MKLKCFLKKFLSLFMCLIIVFSTTANVFALKSDVCTKSSTTYGNSYYINSIDSFLNYIIPNLLGVTLSDTVKANIYTNQSMSSFLTSFYSSIEEEEIKFKLLNIETSPKSLAKFLSNYPEVSNILEQCSTWTEVNLENVEWGIDDKKSFLEAFGASFSPFNDILYMLLCSGNFNVSFVKFEGSNGYENSIVPFLHALKCENLISQNEFTSQATENKNTMVINIADAFFTLLEKSSQNPIDSLTNILPSFSYFYASGEFDKCLNSLFSPITSNKVVNFIIELNLFELDANNMLSNINNTDKDEAELKLAPLDIVSLSKCGEHNGFEFISNKDAAYPIVLSWVIDTLKLNLNSLSSSGADNTNVLENSPNPLSSLLSIDTKALVDVITLLFTPAEPKPPQNIEYPNITPITAQYTPNLTEKNYNKMLNEIDDLLDDFIKEGSNYEDIGSLASVAIYTNSNITTLITSIYSSFENEELSAVFNLLNIDISPKGVASHLRETKYTHAANVLNKTNSWADMSSEYINWGFYDGSRQGFQNALAAVFRPIFPILRLLLVDEDMLIANSIVVKGADGYNTSIIPILEAFGCESDSIKTYNQYTKTSNSDALIIDILNPVFDLLDNIADNPIKTLTRILPNIIYFINSGALEVCISNLITPITSFADKLSPIYSFDNNSFNLNLPDMNLLVFSLFEGIGIKAPHFDIYKIANMGVQTERTSKRTIDGEYINYIYVEADQTCVLAEFLRFFAKAIRMPENKNLFISSVGDGLGAFDSYSSSFEEQISAMSDDELIEWFYNLLFKERAQIEIAIDDNYSPTIIYKEKAPDYTWIYFVGAYLFVVTIVGLILFLNRRRLYY